VDGASAILTKRTSSIKDLLHFIEDILWSARKTLTTNVTTGYRQIY